MTTSYPGDRRVGTETLAVEVNDAGLISGIGDQAERPLWTLEAVEITTTDHGSVQSAGLTAAQRQAWVTRLNQASAVVQAADVLPAGAAWDGGLVVVVPSTPAMFVAVTGADGRDTAAVTSCASGTPRIVVNPTSLAQGDRWLQSTLTHEAVHVATDSACTAGVSWVVEGLAESVTASADDATAAANVALVKTYLAHHDLPRALPQTVTSPTDYALAQFAVDQVRAHRKADASAFFAHGLADHLTAAEVAEATAWYVEGLRKLR